MRVPSLQAGAGRNLAGLYWWSPLGATCVVESSFGGLPRAGSIVFDMTCHARTRAPGAMARSGQAASAPNGSLSGFRRERRLFARQRNPVVEGDAAVDGDGGAGDV